MHAPATDKYLIFVKLQVEASDSTGMGVEQGRARASMTQVCATSAPPPAQCSMGAVTCPKSQHRRYWVPGQPLLDRH